MTFIGSTIKASPFLRRIGLLLAILGPGFITANVDNDAGGIAAFSMAGAFPFGYSCLWTVIPISLLLIITQEMGLRMGVVTGKGLADLIREQHGLKITFYLMAILMAANIANTVAEFAGVAASLELYAIPKYISVPLAAICVWLFVVKSSYKVVERIFLFACLFYISYVASGYLAHPDWKEVSRAILFPQISWTSSYLYMVVGLIGAAVAPWMQFYLQASTVEKGIVSDDYSKARWDVIIGCIMANIVAFFIMIACGATLGKAGISIESATEAAIALRPLAGAYASHLFAFGLFVASLFAASILPLSTSYTICEGLGFESGINKSIREAPHFYALYTTILAISSLAVLWPHFPLFKIMLFSQVINGMLLPIILYYLIKLAGDVSLMGKFANSPRLNIFYYAIVIAIAALNVVMLVLAVVN